MFDVEGGDTEVKQRWFLHINASGAPDFQFYLLLSHSYSAWARKTV